MVKECKIIIRKSEEGYSCLVCHQNPAGPSSPSPAVGDHVGNSGGSWEQWFLESWNSCETARENRTRNYSCVPQKSRKLVINNLRKKLSEINNFSLLLFVVVRD